MLRASRTGITCSAVCWCAIKGPRGFHMERGTCNTAWFTVYGDPWTIQLSRSSTSLCWNMLYERIMCFSFVTVTILMNLNSLSNLLVIFYVLLVWFIYPKMGIRCLKRITFKGEETSNDVLNKKKMFTPIHSSNPHCMLSTIHINLKEINGMVSTLKMLQPRQVDK